MGKSKKNDLPSRFKNLRQKLALTQPQLGARLGCSTKHVWEIEAGRVNPRRPIMVLFERIEAETADHPWLLTMVQARQLLIGAGRKELVATFDEMMESLAVHLLAALQHALERKRRHLATFISLSAESTDRAETRRQDTAGSLAITISQIHNYIERIHAIKGPDFIPADVLADAQWDPDVLKALEHLPPPARHPSGDTP